MGSLFYKLNLVKALIFSNRPLGGIKKEVNKLIN